MNLQEYIEISKERLKSLKKTIKSKEFEKHYKSFSEEAYLKQYSYVRGKIWELDHVITDLEGLSTTTNERTYTYTQMIEQFLLTNPNKILYMKNKTLSNFADTECSFEDSGKKYLGLYTDSYFFQWVAFDDINGEYDFTYSPATEIGKQIDEPLAKYLWKYASINEMDI